MDGTDTTQQERLHGPSCKTNRIIILQYILQNENSEYLRILNI